METTFERIEKMRAALRAEYGPDAENTIIAAIDRESSRLRWRAIRS